MSQQSQVEGIPLVNNPNPVLVSFAGGVSGGTSAVDKSAFTPSVSSETPIGGIVDDVATSTVGEGETGVARITAYRAIHSFIVNALGVALGTLTAPFRVDPTGTTTQPVTVKDGTNASCMDDANHALQVNVVAGAIVDPKSPTASDTAPITVDITPAVSIIASNASRKAVYVFNVSTGGQTIKLGYGAAPTNYNIPILPNGGFVETVYTGQIKAIASANGAIATVVEM